MSRPYFPRGKENRNFQNLKMVGETKKRSKGTKEECQICGKAISNLKSHMYVHTKERPFKCADCGEGFKRQSELTRHLKTHTNKRPFKCEQCEKTYTFKFNLNRHVQTEHSGAKYLDTTVPLLMHQNETKNKTSQEREDLQRLF